MHICRNSDLKVMLGLATLRNAKSHLEKSCKTWGNALVAANDLGKSSSSANEFTRPFDVRVRWRQGHLK